MTESTVSAPRDRAASVARAFAMFRPQPKSKAVSREAKNLARLTKGMGLSKSQIRELGRTLHAPSAAPATTRRAPLTTANRIAATNLCGLSECVGYQPKISLQPVFLCEMALHTIN